MIEDSQDATLGRGRSQPATPEPVEQVEADPGAVFEAYDATSVDELVESEEESDDPDGCTADDVAVAAMFDDGLEAPEPGEEHASDREHEHAAEHDARRDVARNGASDASDLRAEPGSDLFGELSGNGSDEATGSAEQTSDELAEDAEVAAALEAAESVHEGELPDEIPFE